MALYPYGLAHHDNSIQTNVYANNPRDRSVGLDHMGARFYAPELGVWTSADPAILVKPEQYVTADFAAGNAYAYANLRPTIAADRDGQFWHIAAGAAVGALIGGGVEAARQYVSTGKVEDWGRVGSAAAGGAVAGTVAAANPVVGLASMMGVGAASGAAGGLTTRLVQSGGKAAGTLTDVAVDAGVGAATAGIVKGGSTVLRRVAPAKPVAPPSSRGAVQSSAAKEEAAAAAKRSGTELVHRWMSRAELEATQSTGLLRGGREGTHYVTDAANSTAKRAQQRLALPQTPQVRVTMEVSSGALSAPSKVKPDFNMPGGGMERTAAGVVPVTIIRW